MGILAQCTAEAHSLLDKSETQTDVLTAFANINDARAQVGKMNARVTVLSMAVRLMSQTKNKNKDLKEDCFGLLSREGMVSNVKPDDFARRIGDWSQDLAKLW